MLVDCELIEQDVVKCGLLECDDIQEQLVLVCLNVFVVVEFEDYVKNSFVIEEELYKQYDKIKVQFGNGKEYYVYYILVDKEVDVKVIIVKLKVGVKFEDIVKVQLKDKGLGVNGGDLDWVNLGIYVLEFLVVFISLKKGQIIQMLVKM